MSEYVVRLRCFGVSVVFQTLMHRLCPSGCSAATTNLLSYDTMMTFIGLSNGSLVLFCEQLEKSEDFDLRRRIRSRLRAINKTKPGCNVCMPQMPQFNIIVLILTILSLAVIFILLTIDTK